MAAITLGMGTNAAYIESGQELAHLNGPSPTSREVVSKINQLNGICNLTISLIMFLNCRGSAWNGAIFVHHIFR